MRFLRAPKADAEVRSAVALGGPDPVVMWRVKMHRFDVAEFEKLGLTADVLVTPIIKQVGPRLPGATLASSP